MCAKSTSQANQSSSIVDNRVAASDAARAVSLPGNITFGNVGNTSTSAAKTNSSQAAQQWAALMAQQKYDATMIGQTPESATTQAVTYTESGGLSVVGSSNRVTVTDGGAVAAALGTVRETTADALAAIGNASSGFSSSIDKILKAQTDLAESAATGGAATTQKNFNYLALGAFSLIGLVIWNRKQ